MKAPSRIPARALCRQGKARLSSNEHFLGALGRGFLMKWMTASAIAACLLLLLGTRGPARAAVTSVTVVSSTELGTFGHRDYREVKIRMRGTAPGGAYDVPVTLAFPERSKDYSGVALVDVINTALVAPPPPAPGTSVPAPAARL